VVEMKIVHTYINNMGIEKEDNFAEKWHLTQQQEGNDVTLICGSNENKRKEYFWKGIKVIELPSFIQLTTSTKILKGLVKELMNIEADVFYTHHYCSFIPEVTAIIGKIRRIPINLVIHNTFKERSGLIGMAERMYLLFMQPFFMLYNKVYFVSDNLKNKKYFLISKKKKEVWMNNIVVPEKIDIEQKKNTILFVGRVNYVKGVDIILKAMVYVKKYIPNIKLRIVGKQCDDTYMRELSDFLISNKLDVTYLGPLYGKEKWEEFYSCSILVVPSREEGYGNVAKEGLLCGIPTLVSGKGGLSEIVSYDEKIIFKSEKDLAKKIINVLEERKKSNVNDVEVNVI